MVKRILYNNEDTMPAVSDYDLVIIDEAHRGYILDKEMGEDEILYRDQHRVIAYNGIALFIVDTLCAQFGGQPMGSVMVNQIISGGQAGGPDDP